MLDTSALYAVLDRDDANHVTALPIWARLLQSAEPLLCTNYIVLETVALLQRRAGLPAVRKLVDEVLPGDRGAVGGAGGS